MKQYILPLAGALAIVCGTSCSTRYESTSTNAWATVKPQIESYNELTMTLDTKPISYTIDVSTPDGRLKLNKLSLAQASELALVEAIMANQCATLFNPQYTHLVKGGKVLRITVYGYPARYKHKQAEE